jgi:hypothetical protein
LILRDLPEKPLTRPLLLDFAILQLRYNHGKLIRYANLLIITKKVNFEVCGKDPFASLKKLKFYSGVLTNELALCRLARPLRQQNQNLQSEYKKKEKKFFVVIEKTYSPRSVIADLRAQNLTHR